MKRVLFVQNGEGDGPFLLAAALAECGVALEVIHAWHRQPLPKALSDFHGLAIGGGSMSAYQLSEFEFLSDELALITQASAEQKPVLGMCLGAQLMATAFGGKGFPNSAKEIGLHEVSFTPEADSDPLWHGLTAPFHPVHWHGDTFSLPGGATLLASSQITPHQLFRLDHRHYGFQFHLEMA
jgi:GMP synthase (glutamine-hydrolysing)